MKKQKLWLSWLLALCMVGACVAAVGCNNGENSDGNSNGGDSTESVLPDTGASDESDGGDMSDEDTTSDDTTDSDTTSDDTTDSDTTSDDTTDSDTTSDDTTDSDTTSDDTTSDDVDDSTSDSTPDDSTSDPTPDDSSSDGEGDDSEDDTPEEHVHFAENWTLAVSPTDSSVWQLVGDCENCEETITTVLPAFNESNYYVEEPLCTDEAPKRKYGVYVDGRGVLYTEAHEDTTLVWVAMRDAAAYHVAYAQGDRYIMNKDKYPMNGDGSYASVIVEFVNEESTCTEEGRGCLTCDECGDSLLVRTYREHELDMGDGRIELAPTCTESGILYCKCTVCEEELQMDISPRGHDGEGTLVRVTDTEFDFFYECERGCGVIIAERVSLQTAENPSGEVEYTGTEYYVYYEGICYFIPEENVQ